jgi:myo-inositol 2-dehydrogenase/D-chiro-inositol 1-dehydrogenase/scyllo-inositol 2-dehydrogenase (NAD+)
LSRTGFCLIGAGRAGLVHAENLRSRIPAAKLIALCDADEKSLASAGRQFEVGTLVTDYREAIARDDVDAVAIVTPTFLHCQMACFAAEAGKHVFLEKPMAITVDECRRINSAVKRAGVKLQIGFMRRFDERFMEAKEVLDSGALGRTMIIKSTGRGPGGPGPWMYDLERSNGIIAEVNSHDVDSLRWLAGSRLRRVYAESHNFKCPDAKEQYPDFYDNFVASFRFANDTLGVVDGTCPAHYGYDARVEILCEKGMLCVGNTAQPGLAKVTADGTVAARAVKSWRTLFREAYLAEMRHFVECLFEDRPPRVTGHDGLEAVAAVVAQNESMRLGSPVEIEQENDPEE